jgi:Flp pilus assembly protein TadD
MQRLIWMCGLAVACGSAMVAQQLPAGTQEAGTVSPQQAMVDARTNDAEALLEKQDFAGAATKLKALAAEQPKNARVLYDLGFAEERMGDDADASVAYTNAIAADPALGDPRVALGLLDARAGRMDKAHAELLGAANLSGEAPVLRGRALRALARMDETKNPSAARQELIAAVKLTGESPEDVMMGADMAAQAGDDADAEAAYRRAVTLEPGNVDAVVGLAHELVKEGKNDGAESVLVGAMKAHPDDPRVVSQLAVLYVAENKTALAIPLIEKLRASRAVYAEDTQLTGMLAHLYSLNGQFAQAEALYRDMVARSPDDPELLDELGGTLVEQQKYPEAEAVLMKAVAMRSAFATPQDWATAAEHLAYAASKNKQPRTTLQVLADRATVTPETPETLWLEAISHDTLRERKEAAASYRAFLAVANGKFPDEEFEAKHRLVALDNTR